MHIDAVVEFDTKEKFITKFATSHTVKMFQKKIFLPYYFSFRHIQENLGKNYTQKKSRYPEYNLKFLLN